MNRVLTEVESFIKTSTSLDIVSAELKKLTQSFLYFMKLGRYVGSYQKVSLPVLPDRLFVAHPHP